MVEKVKSALEEAIREWWKPATIVILAAILLFFNAAANSSTQRRLESVAFETHSALCTLVDDIERRVENAQRFLRRHPQGIEGISRLDIQRSIDAQKDTLYALRDLNCNNGGS
jgi:hypothetical protein